MRGGGGVWRVGNEEDNKRNVFVGKLYLTDSHSQYSSHSRTGEHVGKAL